MDVKQLLPLVSTSFIAISAVLVAFGWRQIRKGNRRTHRRLMLWGALFATAFFSVYMARTLFIGDTLFAADGPAAIRRAYYVFLVFHIVLATTSACFGLVTLWLAFKERLAKHKRLGRWTAVMWLCTAPTGIAVYVILYLLYPGATTQPIINAMLGN